MKTRKRLATLFLAVCLLLSMAVPAVWAEEADGVLTYSFGAGDDSVIEIMYSGTWNYVHSDPNPAEPFAINGNGNVWYLNQSAADNTRENVDGAYYPNSSWTSKNAFVAGFNGSADVNDGQWIALQIDDVTADTYDLTFRTGKAKEGGIVKVYVLDKAVYTDAIAKANPGVALSSNTVLTQNQNKNVYDYLSNNNGILNDTTKSVLDCSDKAESEYQSIGNVTFANGEDKDDYVLLFQIVGRNENAKTSAYSLNIRSVTLTPVETAADEAKIGETAYATVEEAIENAQSGDEIDLQADAQVDEIAIPAGVTLDLNGKTLNAGTVNCAGAVIDSTNGDGLLVTSDITYTGNNGNYLPLKDSDGYRLYEVKIEKLGINNKTNDSAKFWFHLNFTNTDVYAKIKSGSLTGLDFGAKLNWIGAANPTEAWASSQDGFIGSWAEAVDADAEIDIGLTVKGLAGVEGFALTPMVKANGVTISAEAISLS